jgi:hypothetical protein
LELFESGLRHGRPPMDESSEPYPTSSAGRQANDRGVVHEPPLIRGRDGVGALGSGN